MQETFSGSFTQQEPIPEAAIAAAEAVLRSGRLHRYNLTPGDPGETGLLEQEFADLVGARYCLAVASGGYALQAGLRAMGVGPGDRVLTNAFTLAPVPGAIAAVGATPVYVGSDEELRIDLDDLVAKAPLASVLMLSHMRGHLCDMDRLMEIAQEHGLRVIEDCAHTMGASWSGTPSGRFGAVGCYSTQTYKHINSGEGGFLVTDDADLAARAILVSGSYMLYGRHVAAPDEEVFARHKMTMPNISARMDHLRAAILRPQLALLARNVREWNARYRALEAVLTGSNGIRLIQRPAKEGMAASSFQFRLPDFRADQIAGFVAGCAARGVELKWFGAKDPVAFTATYRHWQYAPEQALPETDRILSSLIDMRLPLTFSIADVETIGRIIRDEAGRAATSVAAE
ncbi:MAG: aminotransferase class I/II-fold pyridoxal phosphate-dependent enzyme [Pseudomonadota bacterium]